MAEAVGLVASVIAVAGLAGTALGFVKNARSWARDLKTVRGELSRSIHHINHTAETINIAQDVLLQYCRRGGTDQSAVINFMETQISSGYLATESSLIKSHVKWLEDEIGSLLDIRWTPIITLKWRILLRREMEVLRVDMSYVETNLSLLMNSVKLEMEMRKDDKNKVDIEYLRRTIRESERVMRRLRKDRRESGHGPGPYEFSSSAKSPLLQEEVDLLLVLARAVRRTGTAPVVSGGPHPPAAARDSTRSTTTMPNSRHSADGRAARSSASLGPAPEPRRPASSRRDGFPSEIERWQTPVASVRNNSRLSSRPSDEVLRMVASEDHQRFPGQIERPDGSWQDVSGIREPEQTFNSMTDFRARELGLLDRVDPYTGEGGQTWVESLNGRAIRPTGTLRVRWKAPRSRPISLLFWVFPYGSERDLVLGEPFVRKMDH